jgi:hypothetical protein
MGSNGWRLTEQDPHPQLEHSPLQEQVLQSLFLWLADVLPSCMVDIRVCPAPAFLVHRAQTLKLQASILLTIKVGETYHGDMMKVIG